MAEPDSWEDVEEGGGGASRRSPQTTTSVAAAAGAAKLNADAPAFTFNPSAASFTPFVPAPAAVVYHPVAAGPPPKPHFHDVNASADLHSAHQTPFMSGASALPALAGRNTEPPQETDVASELVVDSSQAPETRDLDVDLKEDAAEEQIPPPAAEEKDAAAPSNGSVEKEENEEVAHEGESKSAEALEADKDDSRQHLNVVFIGHVDAGKSTIGGQILYLSNMVDERTIQKYEREAKEKNRESWYMAYIMDTNEEERAKGKTVEVGRAHFETKKTRFTILDAPGHKNYVPNMISGASQADVGVLVIAARRGEFETGFERGGQTREHAQLAKTLGVSKLLVVVNKMDDPSVQWSKERFDEIEKKIIPFLRSCGYNVKKDVQFLPISGLFGHNMKERMPKTMCDWWDGPCLFEALDSVELPERDPKGPFRMPLIDKYRDMGTVVMGKIESGSVRRGDTLMIMPNKATVKVVTVYRDNDEVNYARPGENLRIRLSGVEEEDISPGFVLSSVRSPIPAVLEFDAQLQILELLDHKAIFTAGYKAVLHIHAVVEECEIMGLLHQIDPKTKRPIRKKILFVKSGAVVVVRLQVNELICVEKFEDFPQLGRFTLRDEGKTVAIGKVVNFPRVAGTQN
ncbi:unnamed protein product [Sphagnum jensenii]|uniref:Tr-type G domain-containing protein n=1 Tax=Sphagnum jensenii TaxID=128206 RepID=A0ABP0VUC7_9BRYO